MKKQLLFILFVVLFCAGCGKKNTSVYDTEDQYYWSRTNIAACEEGYYICQEGQFTIEMKDAYGNVIPTIDGFQVFFYDVNEKELVAWCDRVDCSHNNVFCSSFFENESWLQQVYYYGGYVYMISMDDDYYYLEQFDQSGNNQKRLGEICTLDKLNTDFGLRFYNQNLYFCKTGDEAGLYEKDLSKMSDDHTLFSLNAGQGLSRIRFQITDGVMYYGLVETNEDTCQTVFWKRDMESGEQEQLFTADTRASSAAFVGDSIYYYEDGTGLVRALTETGQKECIYQETDQTERKVYWDGTYIYLENVTAGVTYYDAFISGTASEDDPNIRVTYKVFSVEGEQVDEIGVQSIVNDQVVEYQNQDIYPMAFYGDNRYMFMYYPGDDLLAFDKTQIGNDDQIWSRLEWGRDSFDYSENAVFSSEDVASENEMEEPETIDFSDRVLYTKEEYEQLKKKGNRCFLKQEDRFILG